jgi:hypothetical protein
VRPGHLHGKPLAAFVVYDDRWEFTVMLNRLRLGGEPRVEESPLRLRRRGGEAAAVLVTVAVVRDRQGAVRALRWLVRDPAGTGGPEPLLVVSIDQAIRQAEARRRQHEAGSAFARAQEHLAEGPGPDACAGDRPVWSSDLPADLRWSRLQPAAAVNRAGAVVAVPVRLYGGPIGVCLLTSASPRPWTDADVEAAEAYAVMLAGLLEVAAEARRSATFARRVRRRWSGPPARPTTTRPSRRLAQPRSAATTWRSGWPT